MNIFEIFLIAVSLSMDAFAVSICKGLCVRKLSFRDLLTVGIYFGGFQAIMPLIGYIVGQQFASFIDHYDHWIVFILLLLIGANMIREAIKEENDVQCCSISPNFSFKTMFPLAVATSIDALAIGVSFAFLEVNIIFSIALIGCTTFVLSAVGLSIGHIFGAKYKSTAEIAGGFILIIMGVKILLQGIGLF